MITNRDLQIENKSYTNKDFSTVYEEIVEIVNKLTDKWNPRETNEADPGVVLLKVAAFLTDKLNYNIDKNTLEKFITSATQLSSIKDITSRLGYSIPYINSGVVDISFSYRGGNQAIDQELDNEGSITFHKLANSFKTEDGIIYTLLDDIIISKEDRTKVGIKAIQGELFVLKNSLDSTNTKIQLVNLDSYNRIYFPDKNVAQNGIFINKEIYSDISDDAWRRVDNLNDISDTSRVYEFGFDYKRNLPYIQFPNSIEALIGDGLEIWYIVSDGLAGAISTNKLIAFDKIFVTKTSGEEELSVGSIDPKTYLIANTSAIGQRESQSIDEIYKNFKKTVGIFNTLVSCRDYTNKIRTLKNQRTNANYVSNCVVTDIRTDLAQTLQLNVRNNLGSSVFKTVFRDIGEQDFDPDFTKLKIHGLKYVGDDIKTVARYNNSYLPITQYDVDNIEVELENCKTLSYNLIKVPETEISFINNKHTLKISIFPTKRTTLLEESVIIENIKRALFNNFNSNKLEFGQPIPYESLINVITKADERIKNVYVETPIITPYIVLGNGEAIKFDIANEVCKDIVYDNILAQRIKYLGKDLNHLLEYEMDFEKTSIEKEVKGIYAATSLASGGKLDEDKQILQIISPSYSIQEKGSFVVNVFYHLKFADNKECIAKDTVYKLQENDELIFYYVDSSQQNQFVIVPEGTPVRPNFNMHKTEGISGAIRYLKQTNKDKDLLL